MMRQKVCARIDGLKRRKILSEDFQSGKLFGEGTARLRDRKNLICDNWYIFLLTENMLSVKIVIHIWEHLKELLRPFRLTIPVYE